MRHFADTKNVGSFDESRQAETSFVQLCALQLKLAIDESCVEMDSLAADLIDASDNPSAELITRLQSVDRLMQRLTNVHTNLDRFAQFIQNSGSGNEEPDWEIFLKEARETFTMEQECKLFDSVLTGFEEE